MTSEPEVAADADSASVSVDLASGRRLSLHAARGGGLSIEVVSASRSWFCLSDASDIGQPQDGEGPICCADVTIEEANHLIAILANLVEMAWAADPEQAAQVWVAAAGGPKPPTVIDWPGESDG
jgi:hypothetical protein